MPFFVRAKLAQPAVKVELAYDHFVQSVFP